MISSRKLSALFGIQIVLVGLPVFLSAEDAHALPAFARREEAACTLCHSNGSAPHLTKAGYMFRRAGFRMPGDIGNEQLDAKNMTIQNHMTAGINVDYQVAQAIPPGAP